MVKSFKYRSNSVNDTQTLGEMIGSFIVAEEEIAKSQIILLKGNLGSGKTVIVQGISRGLGLNAAVTSPTYNLVNEYTGSISLYHMDLYRLDKEEDLLNIGFTEYIYERDGVVVIEWPEIAGIYLPEDFLEIKLSLLDPDTRDILITARGQNSLELWKGLKNHVSFGD